MQLIALLCMQFSECIIRIKRSNKILYVLCVCVPTINCTPFLCKNCLKNRLKTWTVFSSKNRPQILNESDKKKHTSTSWNQIPNHNRSNTNKSAHRFRSERRAPTSQNRFSVFSGRTRINQDRVYVGHISHLLRLWYHNYSPANSYPFGKTTDLSGSRSERVVIRADHKAYHYLTYL